MNLPERKSIRLKYCDYSSPGAYFVTVCTKNKQNLFWNKRTEQIHAVGAATRRPQNETVLPAALTKTGMLVDCAIQNIPEIYPGVFLNEREYCEIWNHIDGNPYKWTDDCYYYEY